MKASRQRIDTSMVVVGLCVLSYAAIGAAFIPLLGIQNDEALFGAGLYRKNEIAYSMKIFEHQVPLMLMSHVGALKSWVYTGIFTTWKPSAFAVRLPMLLIGGVTIWVFHRLMVRCADRRAAAVACLLLASDSTYLLTTCFDWGPVALRHCLMVFGMLFLLKFHQQRSAKALAVGCFLWGLGLWDKAVFAWSLAGLAGGAFAAFPRQVVQHLRIRLVAIATLCFCFGALPLLLYNATHELATVRANVQFSPTSLPWKLAVLRDTLDGSALFGYLVQEESGIPQQPTTGTQKASLWLSGATGHPKASLLVWALLIAAVTIPVFHRSQMRGPLLFGFVCFAVTWTLMALAGGGGAAHHTVLLWPLPQFVIGTAFAAGWRLFSRTVRITLAVFVAVVLGANLLVVNQYYAQVVQYRGGKGWTDAIYALSSFLGEMPLRTIVITDWGMHNSLSVLHEGNLNLVVIDDSLAHRQPNSSEEVFLRSLISDADTLFVRHTPEYTFFAGINERLSEVAQRIGYRKEVLKVIVSQDGKGVFELYAFQPCRPPPHG